MVKSIKSIIIYCYRKQTNTMHNSVYILSLHCNYMFRSQLTIFMVLVVTEYNNSVCAYVQDIMIH
jgi:hypothetical protein